MQEGNTEYKSTKARYLVIDDNLLMPRHFPADFSLNLDNDDSEAGLHFSPFVDAKGQPDGIVIKESLSVPDQQNLRRRARREFVNGRSILSLLTQLQAAHRYKLVLYSRHTAIELANEIIFPLAKACKKLGIKIPRFDVILCAETDETDSRFEKSFAATKAFSRCLIRYKVNFRPEDLETAINGLNQIATEQQKEYTVFSESSYVIGKAQEWGFEKSFLVTPMETFADQLRRATALIDGTRSSGSVIKYSKIPKLKNPNYEGMINSQEIKDALFELSKSFGFGGSNLHVMLGLEKAGGEFRSDQARQSTRFRRAGDKHYYINFPAVLDPDHRFPDFNVSEPFPGLLGVPGLFVSEGPQQNEFKDTLTDFYGLLFMNPYVNFENVIVVGNPVEQGVAKYHPYFDPSKNKFAKAKGSTGDIQVYQLKKPGKKSSEATHTVYHIADVADHGTLTDDEIVAKMRTLAILETSTSNTPYLLHCSAGLGRSGIFAMAFYLNRTEIKEWVMQGSADDVALKILLLWNYANERRPGLIQTAQQLMNALDVAASIMSPQEYEKKVKEAQLEVRRAGATLVMGSRARKDTMPKEEQGTLSRQQLARLRAKERAGSNAGTAEMTLPPKREQSPPPEDSKTAASPAAAALKSSVVSSGKPPPPSKKKKDKTKAERPRVADNAPPVGGMYAELPPKPAAGGQQQGIYAPLSVDPKGQLAPMGGVYAQLPSQPPASGVYLPGVPQLQPEPAKRLAENRVVQEIFPAKPAAPAESAKDQYGDLSLVRREPVSPAAQPQQYGPLPTPQSGPAQQGLPALSSAAPAGQMYGRLPSATSTLAPAVSNVYGPCPGGDQSASTMQGPVYGKVPIGKSVKAAPLTYDKVPPEQAAGRAFPKHGASGDYTQFTSSTPAVEADGPYAHLEMSQLIDPGAQGGEAALPSQMFVPQGASTEADDAQQRFAQRRSQVMSIVLEHGAPWLAQAASPQPEFPPVAPLGQQVQYEELPTNSQRMAMLPQPIMGRVLNTGASSHATGDSHSGRSVPFAQAAPAEEGLPPSGYLPPVDLQAPATAQPPAAWQEPVEPPPIPASLPPKDLASPSVEKTVQADAGGLRKRHSTVQSDTPLGQAQQAIAVLVKTVERLDPGKNQLKEQTHQCLQGIIQQAQLIVDDTSVSEEKLKFAASLLGAANEMLDLSFNLNEKLLDRQMRLKTISSFQQRLTKKLPDETIYFYFERFAKALTSDAKKINFIYQTRALGALTHEHDQYESYQLKDRLKDLYSYLDTYYYRNLDKYEDSSTVINNVSREVTGLIAALHAYKASLGDDKSGYDTFKRALESFEKKYDVAPPALREQVAMVVVTVLAIAVGLFIGALIFGLLPALALPFAQTMALGGKWAAAAAVSVTTGGGVGGTCYALKFQHRGLDKHLADIRKEVSSCAKGIKQQQKIRAEAAFDTASSDALPLLQGH